MFKIHLAIAAHKSQLLVAVWSSEDVLCVPSASRRPAADPDRTEGIVCTRGPPTSGRSRSGHRNGATTKTLKQLRPCIVSGLVASGPVSGPARLPDEVSEPLPVRDGSGSETSNGG